MHGHRDTEINIHIHIYTQLYKPHSDTQINGDTGTYIHINGHTDIQICRHTYIHTTHRHTYRHTNAWTHRYIQICTQIYRDTQTYSNKHIDTHRHTTNMHTYSHTHTWTHHTHIHTYSHTHTWTHR